MVFGTITNNSLSSIKRYVFLANTAWVVLVLFFVKSPSIRWSAIDWITFLIMFNILMPTDTCANRKYFIIALVLLHIALLIELLLVIFWQ